MTDVSSAELQHASQITHKCDYPQGLRIATGINADPNGICQAVWGRDLNACYTELLGTGVAGSGGLLNSHALLLPGTTGSFISTPDAVALDIVGDIDIRVEATSHPGGGIFQGVVSKWNPTGNQRSYTFQTVFGLINLIWSTDGIAELSSPTDNPQIFVSAGLATRIDMDVVSGTDRVIRRQSASSLSGPWTVLDSDTIAGTTSIFAGTAVLAVGAWSDGTNPFLGRISRVEVRSGIDGTVVANPDFRALAAGTTSFADGTGKTWTVQGNAKIV